MGTLASVKTDTNISVVQQAFENFLKGNIPAILESCTEDIQWGSYANPDVPFSSTYTGKNGVGQFFTDLSGSVDIENFQTSQFYGDNDNVFVVGNHKGKVKSTGKNFGHDFLMQFRLREGKVSNYFAWVDTHDQAQAFNATTHDSPAINAVKDLYAKFFQGNIPGIIEMMTDDMKWDATRNPYLPEAKVFKGKNEVLAFFNQVNELMEFKEFAPEHFYQKGNNVFVNGHFELLLKKNNQPVSLDWTMRWTFRDDKICAFAEYFAPAGS